MELEDAISYLEKVILVNKGIIEQARKSNEKQLADDVNTQNVALETVLQALENKNVGSRRNGKTIKIKEELWEELRKLPKNIWCGIYSNEGIICLSKDEFIPKKKIEDIKSKYEKHNAVAIKQLEEVGTRDCFDNELAIRDLGAIRACEELLEDK